MQKKCYTCANITQKMVTCSRIMRTKPFLTALLTLLVPLLLLAQGRTITGNASYYADRFHGRRTASGELYNKDSMTCAHLRYPFGTVLKVRNPLNDRTVYVRVTDRGPYSKRFTIDLSRAAARELDIIRSGFSMVEITPFLPDEVPYLPNGNAGLDLPELDLTYTPVATFPVPAWQSDTTKVSRELKELISSWHTESR